MTDVSGGGVKKHALPLWLDSVSRTKWKEEEEITSLFSFFAFKKKKLLFIPSLQKKTQISNLTCKFICLFLFISKRDKGNDTGL